MEVGSIVYEKVTSGVYAYSVQRVLKELRFQKFGNYIGLPL